MAVHLRGRGALVGFLEWDIATGKGIDDHLAAVGPDTVLGEIATVEYASAVRPSRLMKCSSRKLEMRGKELSPVEKRWSP